MRAILGIDAAWTPHHPSGVALIQESSSGAWECVALAGSYECFLEQAYLQLAPHQADSVPVANLILAAKKLTKAEVCLIVADIPLSKEKITCRRPADDQASQRFGRCDCSTHTPSANRPGRVSEEIRDGFAKFGFTLATHPRNRPNRALIETYPHPALLALMKVNYRVPYKVSKSRKYFPNLDIQQRFGHIASKLTEIRTELSRTIYGVSLRIPIWPASLSALKPIEDQIDALVCAWVGIQVLEGRATVFGDQNAAIWLPQDSLYFALPKDWSEYLKSDAIASKEFMQNVEDLPVQDREFFHSDSKMRVPRAPRN